MTWVAWRQHRMQIIWGAAAVGALALFLVPTGLGMAHNFTSSGLGRCLSTAGADCGSLSRWTRVAQLTIYPAGCDCRAVSI